MRCMGETLLCEAYLSPRCYLRARFYPCWGAHRTAYSRLNNPRLDPRRDIRTFGAVVKILKATGVACSFAMVKVLWTDSVNGPKGKRGVHRSSKLNGMTDHESGASCRERDGRTHLEKLIRREKGVPMDDEMQWLQN